MTKPPYDREVLEEINGPLADEDYENLAAFAREAAEQYDPRVRFRCYVAGELVDEAWIDATDPDAQRLVTEVQRRHDQLVTAADEAGQVWMVETYDPAEPEDRAHRRMGTDANGMVDPQPVHLIDVRGPVGAPGYEEGLFVAFCSAGDWNSSAGAEDEVRRAGHQHVELKNVFPEMVIRREGLT